MQTFGLDLEDVLGIQNALLKQPEIERVILYGSRAMGNYKPYSDIDISLVGQEVTLDTVFRLEEDLEDLYLPQRFDISIYNRITDPAFKAHIDTKGLEFFRKPALPV